MGVFVRIVRLGWWRLQVKLKVYTPELHQWPRNPIRYFVCYPICNAISVSEAMNTTSEIHSYLRNILWHLCIWRPDIPPCCTPVHAGSRRDHKFIWSWIFSTIQYLNRWCGPIGTTTLCQCNLTWNATSWSCSQPCDPLGIIQWCKIASGNFH
jgi:hypothetical protein